MEFKEFGERGGESGKKQPEKAGKFKRLVHRREIKNKSHLAVTLTEHSLTRAAGQHLLSAGLVNGRAYVFPVFRQEVDSIGYI